MQTLKRYYNAKYNNVKHITIIQLHKEISISTTKLLFC